MIKMCARWTQDFTCKEWRIVDLSIVGDDHVFGQLANGEMHLEVEHVITRLESLSAGGD